MTTISLHECITPVSLRTCGSSCGSLLQKRRQLKSPEKLIRRKAPNKPRIPELCGVSISPNKQLGLDDIGVSRLPFNSPVPRWQYEGYCTTSSTSSPSSSDEFSDEELCFGTADSCRQDTPDRLFIVGSKQRISCKFDTPKPLSCDSKARDSFTVQHQPDDGTKSADLELDRDLDAGSTSPENPPPSPINFRSSMDGFVMGGRHISCPERAKSTAGVDYTCRDFNPGFVKHPLYHCAKCEERVVEQEKTQNVLQRRHSTFLNSRASPYRHSECRLGVKSSLATPTSMYVCNTDYYDHAHSSSDEYMRTFVEVYTEKKRQKEERDEKENRKKDERKKEEAVKMLERSKRVDGRIPEVKGKKIPKESSSSQAEFSTRSALCISGSNKLPGTKLLVIQNGPNSCTTDNTILEDTPAISDSNKTTTDDTANTLGATSAGDSQPSRVTVLSRVGDLSVASTLRGDEDTTATGSSPRPAVNSISLCCLMDKCQVRRCWSDIWPFPDEKSAVVRGTDETEDILSNYMSPAKNKSRITPFYPLPLTAIAPQKAAQTMTSKSVESVTSLIGKHGASSTDQIVKLKSEKDGESGSTVSKQPTIASEEQNTMAATVIVPPMTRSCTQWVSFNADQEPVLNNSPPVDDNCDTFLKRLQRTKVHANSDATVPTGNQFCFEAMVDKRYNRWKRRRRNRKEVEFQRSTAPPSSDSSDEDEDGERRSAMERIIDHMYEEMHGAPPETPNGSRDTPRVRNRRRRREHGDDTDHKSSTNKQGEAGSNAVHYDASSEWTSSEQDPTQLSSNSGVGIGDATDRPTTSHSDVTDTQYADTPVVRTARFADTLTAMVDPPERSSSPAKPDDLYRWPFMEEYKIEIMKRIQATPPEQLDELRQRDWLPKIPSRPSSRKEKPDTSIYNGDHKRSPSPPDDVPAPLEPLDRRRSICASAVTGNEDPAPTDKPVIKVRVDSSRDKQMYQKWSRKSTVGFGSTSKQREDVSRPAPIPRNTASTWSEMGIHPKPIKPHKPISVVSVGGAITSPLPRVSATTFNAALRPIRSTETSDKLRKQTATKQGKKSDVNLPSVTKNARKQTVPRHPQQRRHAAAGSEKTLAATAKVEKVPRKKSKVQSSTTIPSFRGKQVAFENQSSTDLVFRRLYMRSLYGHKVRMNSHINSDSRGTLRESITVGKLDIGSRKPAKQPVKSSGMSELSVTRAFTFSLFDLPEVHRMYNRTILQRARGELTVEDSDE